MARFAMNKKNPVELRARMFAELARISHTNQMHRGSE
jgi:hypothetical protein